MRKQSIGCILGFMMIFAASGLMAANLSGTWNADVALEDGAGGTATFVWSEKNGVITGSYTGNQGADCKITGSVKDGKVEWSFEGNEGLITFKGDMQEDGTITGECKYPCCAGIFTAYK